MTRKHALQVLIRHAANDVAGAGCGIREHVTKERQEVVARAIQRVYIETFGYPFSEADAYYYGLPFLGTTGDER